MTLRKLPLVNIVGLGENAPQNVFCSIEQLKIWSSPKCSLLDLNVAQMTVTVFLFTKLKAFTDHKF